MHDRREFVSEVKSMLKNMTQALVICRSVGKPGMLRALEILKHVIPPMSEICVYKL